MYGDEISNIQWLHLLRAIRHHPGPLQLDFYGLSTDRDCLDFSYRTNCFAGYTDVDPETMVCAEDYDECDCHDDVRL